MPNYLSKRDWRRLIDQKQYKSVKKTGISETLETLAAAIKKDDPGKVVSAAETVINTATKQQSQQKAYPEIVDFLKEMVSAAKAKQTEMQRRVAQIPDDDDDEDSNDLGKALRKIKMLSEEKAWNFVLAPGKPSSGLVVNKRVIKKDHIKKAFEMKGKRGPFFMGKIFGDSGKYVLLLEEAPPAGLAKAAKKAALLHAELNIKVLVRGAGVELDDETDIDTAPGMEDGDAPLEETYDAPKFALYAQRISKVRELFEKIRQTPAVKQEGGLDSVYGVLNQIRIAITKDEALEEGERTDLLDAVQRLVTAANTAAKPDAKANYPTAADWKNAAEKIYRMDEDKSEAGWKIFIGRLQQTQQRLDNDTTISERERQEVLQVLRAAYELAKKTSIKSMNLEDEAKQDTGDLEQRFLAMERKVETILRAGLEQDVLRPGILPFRNLRQAMRRGELEDVRQTIAATERGVDDLLRLALAKSRQTSERDDQQNIHETLQPQMEMIRKAAFPRGVLPNPETLRELAGKNPTLRGMLAAGVEVQKDPSPGKIDQLAKLARQVLQEAEDNKPEPPVFDPMSMDEPPTVPDHEPGPDELLAQDILKRAELARIANAYEALGNPPWPEDVAEQAAELQAQFFFAEAAVAKGTPNYQAPALGTESGASGSWWIERAETGPGAKDKRKYIFKPAKLEGDVMTGLPPGSGAPREVLAKKLDDMMAGAGFQVGVCPTTLATIDSSQLGTSDPSGGPMLGSMQKLAPADGQLGEMLKAGDTEIVKIIDKRSFDDVAVFDMVFANLDRHSNNLLIEKDELSGQAKLLPIDHGSALASPDALQANRSSLSPPFNIMADPMLPQTRELMNQDTREALERLDPDLMVRQMKEARNGIVQRHSEADGMIDDSAIEAMAGRIRFLKKAAGRMPVGELFEALAIGAKRIAECDPNDIDALVDQLETEARDRVENRAANNKVQQKFEEVFKSAPVAGLMDQFQALGWCINLDKTSFGTWLDDNPSLASRILQTQMVNPKLKDEMDRLLPLARAQVPNIEAKIAGKPADDQMKALFDAANADVFATPQKPQADLPQVQRKFDELGGIQALKAMAQVVPGIAEFTTLPKEDAEANEKFYYYVDQIGRLQIFNEFNKLGGLAEFLRLGGQITRDIQPKTLLKIFTEMKANETSVTTLMSMDPVALKTLSDKAWSDGIERVTDLVRSVKVTTDRTSLEEQMEAAKTAHDPNDPAIALTLLARLEVRAKAQLADERRCSEEVPEFFDKFWSDLENEEQQVQLALQDERASFDNRVQAFLQQPTTVGASALYREAQVKLDNARLGDQSPMRQIEANLEGHRQRIDALRGWPWHDAVIHHKTELERRIATFDVGNATTSANNINLALTVAETLTKAFDVPQRAELLERFKADVSEWVDNIRNRNKLGRGEEQDLVKRVSDALIDT